MKYLKNIEINLNNVLIIIGNFNIRNSNWNPLYPYYSIHTNILFEIADSLNLDLSSSINPVLTWYVDNPQDANSVIDLIFLCTKSEEFDNHQIMLELHSSSNYASLSVSITIKEEYIQERKQIIIKNNEKEKRFINELRDKINNINTSNILNSETLERLTQKITTIAEDL